MIHPQSQMGLNGFLVVHGDFPVDMAVAFVDALTDLWNEEITQIVDVIILR